MTLRIYETVQLGGKLQKSSKAALILSLKQAGAGIVAILLFAGTVTVINLVTMSRTISHRMARLRHGATLIGEGRLEHRIEIGSSDEFADLAKAFNAMTEKLSGSYHELENEITGRIRAEENLQQAYSELETRVQTRTQELRELTETLEQRVTKRTAELQSANETLRASRLAALNLMEDAVIDRKNLERITANLRDSEERLKRTQEIAHLGGWEFDLAGERLFCSDEVYRIFGFQPQEFEATHEVFLERLHPEDRTAVDAYADSIRKARDE